MALLKRYRLVAFFVLAYAISWAIELPLAASKQGLISFPMPFALHYLAAFGPLLSALVVTGLTQGREGLRALFAGLFKWRVGSGYITWTHRGAICARGKI